MISRLAESFWCLYSLIPSKAAIVPTVSSVRPQLQAEHPSSPTSVPPPAPSVPIPTVFSLTCPHPRVLILLHPLPLFPAWYCSRNAKALNPGLKYFSGSQATVRSLCPAARPQHCPFSILLVSPVLHRGEVSVRSLSSALPKTGPCLSPSRAHSPALLGT